MGLQHRQSREHSLLGCPFERADVGSRREPQALLPRPTPSLESHSAPPSCLYGDTGTSSQQGSASPTLTPLRSAPRCRLGSGSAPGDSKVQRSRARGGGRHRAFQPVSLSAEVEPEFENSHPRALRVHRRANSSVRHPDYPEVEEYSRHSALSPLATGANETFILVRKARGSFRARARATFTKGIISPPNRWFTCPK